MMGLIIASVLGFLAGLLVATAFAYWYAIRENERRSRRIMIRRPECMWPECPQPIECSMAGYCKMPRAP